MRLTPEQYNAITAKKKPKYGNKKKILNGITFDSTREARRYQDLELMQQAGQITDLRRQLPYPVYIKGKLVCKWIADFVYKNDVGVRVIEDSKGFATPEYKLKKRLVEAEYGFEILET